METETPPGLLEQMAALMDGRLAEPERSQLLARIAESEELYQMLLEAGELLGWDSGMNGAGAGGEVSSEGSPLEVGPISGAHPGGQGPAISSHGVGNVEPADSDVADSLPLGQVRRRRLLWALPVLAAAGLAALLLLQPQQPGRQSDRELTVPARPPVALHVPQIDGEVVEGAVVRVAARWFAANASARAGEERAATAELVAIRSDLAPYRIPSMMEDGTALAVEGSRDVNRTIAQLEEDLRLLDRSAFDAGVHLAALRRAALDRSQGDAEEHLQQIRASRAWLEARLGASFFEDLEVGVTAGDFPFVAARVERAMEQLGSLRSAIGIGPPGR